MSKWALLQHWISNPLPVASKIEGTLLFFLGSGWKCVRVCYVCMCICVLVCIWSPRLILVNSSIALHLTYWDRVSHWTWSSLVCLASLLWDYSKTIRNVEFWQPTFQAKCFRHWAISPATRNFFLKKANLDFIYCSKK